MASLVPHQAWSTYTYNPTTQKDRHETGVSLGYRETLSQHITSPNNKTIAKIAATYKDARTSLLHMEVREQRSSEGRTFSPSTPDFRD